MQLCLTSEKGSTIISLHKNNNDYGLHVLPDSNVFAKSWRITQCYHVRGMKRCEFSASQFIFYRVRNPQPRDH